ncbi:MAG: hypothetical protein K1X65_03850 [Caldilineales bacterium]|nr:hypothetical protein [Caldilineales bacterium]
MTPTPPPPDPLMSLPLAFWANLPLVVCLIFAVAIVIGFLIIVRENRRIAARDSVIEEE